MSQITPCRQATSALVDFRAWISFSFRIDLVTYSSSLDDCSITLNVNTCQRNLYKIKVEERDIRGVVSYYS